MPQTIDELTARAKAWLADDPDPDTQAELRDTLARAQAGDPASLASLADAFSGPLTFGTAGLRAALGPGPARMNRVVVTRAAAGFADWLLADGGVAPGAKVLIGYDARHKSSDFARDTAEVMAGAGFTPLLAAHPVPTPVLAFGVVALGCAAGVQVTASHNPAADNGYKVYLGDGSQIIPPTDLQIAARIAARASRPLAEIARADAYQLVDDELIDAYVARVASLVAGTDASQVVWAYTAMHGVGTPVVQRVVEAARLPVPALVREQIDPDPDFPTVPFPNPEEPGAMDMAIALARRCGADIAIATDPDADRCAAAVPVDGVWRRLTGDEVGALLGDDALRRGTDGVYACSLVSSTLLATMARAHGRPFAKTLTGFKWIGRVPGLAFGYEEAIGYCCDPAAVRDKDGISATAALLRLVASLKARRETVADRLAEIDATYGVHATNQHSVRVAQLQQIAAMMANLRANPPASLAGEPVTSSDLLHPADGLAPTDGMEFTGATVHVVVRPSGTEPKLKCYCEARRPAAESAADLASARQKAAETLDELWDEIEAVLRPPAN